MDNADTKEYPVFSGLPKKVPSSTVRTAYWGITASIPAQLLPDVYIVTLVKNFVCNLGVTVVVRRQLVRRLLPPADLILSRTNGGEKEDEQRPKEPPNDVNIPPYKLCFSFQNGHYGFLFLSLAARGR